MQRRLKQPNIIGIRFRSDEERERVKKAASMKRWSMNTFVTETALAEAEKVLKQQERSA